ncbi:MAG TPA: type II toxin-antitoxin system Phd/YefM family antitoxin [Anaerolineae bacterium]|nr:type II toxin-antitoxin system Phd/YefM family antitoxin [Anaerolineae bacterium]
MATQTLPISEARASLPQIVKAADEKFERTVITTNGKPVAVVNLNRTRDHQQRL